MKKLFLVFAYSALVTFSHMAFAATNTQKINIRIIQAPYVELTGSASDGNIREISMDSITVNSITTLGMLGVKSRGSNCSITFSTLNNYALKHETSGRQLKQYYLSYLGNNISSNASGKIELDSYIMPASDLNFVSIGNMPAVIEKGVYKDTITMTLTTE